MRELTEIVDGVFVATSHLDTTTSTLVVADRDVLLVDPAWTPDELAELAAVIASRGWTVTAAVATHAHHDHLLWHPGFGDAPRFASATTCRLAVEHRDELVAQLGDDLPAELSALVGRLTPAPSDGVPFAEPVELVEHDGHCPGHCAVWLPHRGVLLAGDMLSDVELPLPLWPDDLPAYEAGLDRLAPFVARARALVPGHGSATTSPDERLAADRRYFDDLRATGDSADPRTRHPGMADVHRRVSSLVAAAHRKD